MDVDCSEIIRQAARAASAHNTQPWAVTAKDGNLVLHLDRERTLGASDPSERDTMLSLGAFAETLLICASSAGIGLRFVRDYDSTEGRIGRFEHVPELYESPFGLRDVLGRRVWRGGWVSGSPAPETLLDATKVSQKAGFRVVKMPVEEARQLLVDANRWFFRSTEIVAELHRWTRLLPRHPEYNSDGLNDVMLVLSRIERALLRTLIRPSTYRLLHRFGLPELLAKMSTAATKGSGLALGLVGPTGTENQVEAGRLLMRLWLQLRRHGIYVHPQSLLLDCPETRATLEARWHVGPHEHVVSWFRVGHPVSDPNARATHPRRVDIEGT